MHYRIHRITHLIEAIISVLLFLLLSVSPNAVFAAEDHLVDSVNIESKRDPDKVNEIISNTFRKNEIDDFFFNSADSDYRPDTYYVDPADYIVEYNVSETFLDDFMNKGCDYSSLNQLISEHLTIYIPLYSQIKDQSRVIGHCKIYYNVAEDEYVCRTSIMNTSSEAFQNGKNKHFYELIQSLADTKEYDHILLIKLHTAFNDYSEKIALLHKADGDLSVLDLYNSIKDPELQASEVTETKVYKYNDYVELRKKVEQEFNSSGAYGGVNAISKINDDKKSNKALIYVLIPVSLTAVTAMSIIIIVKTKHKVKQ